MSKLADLQTALRQGHMVVLTDDSARENEGDLCVAAELITPAHIAFMARWGRGLVCLSLTPQRVEQLALPMMTAHNRSSFGTPFTVSIEAKTGVGSGISAFDRARTIAVAVDPNSTSADLVSPGHVFPLRAHRHGILGRQGQTEGSLDLLRLCGMQPAAVICEIMNDDGSMIAGAELDTYCTQHRLLQVTTGDIIAWHMAQNSCLNMRSILQPFGAAKSAYLFESKIDHALHLALVRGEPEQHGAGVVACRYADLASCWMLGNQVVATMLQPAYAAWQQAAHTVMLLLHIDGTMATSIADRNSQRTIDVGLIGEMLTSMHIFTWYDLFGRDKLLQPVWLQEPGGFKRSALPPPILGN